jgi:hypothetical protein
MIGYPKKTGDFEPAEFEEGFMVYQAEKDRVHYMNPMAVLILELCTGENTPERIAEVLKQSFHLPEAPMNEVRQTLTTLEGEELIKYEQGVQSHEPN